MFRNFKNFEFKENKRESVRTEGMRDFLRDFYKFRIGEIQKK